MLRIFAFCAVISLTGCAALTGNARPATFDQDLSLAGSFGSVLCKRADNDELRLAATSLVTLLDRGTAPTIADVVSLVMPEYRDEARMLAGIASRYVGADLPPAVREANGMLLLRSAAVGCLDAGGL